MKRLRLLALLVLAWVSFGGAAMAADLRPALLLTYFSDVYDAGHRFGPDSRQLRAA